MSFTSLAFAALLLVTYVVYWAAGADRRRLQNGILLLASTVFYGWWDWRFLALIALSILIDYTVGRALGAATGLRRRKVLLGVSLAVNLGLLGFFKYAGFFVESFRAAFSLGISSGFDMLDIVLPVGISFYTFQTLSYTIDVYRRKLTPSNSLLDFATFVSFFPQLVAGPIERATRLLPQFQAMREFHSGEAADGLRQMLWGFFKKLVVANNCALLADQAFAAPESFSAPTLLVGLLAFTFQIYADFSGYSDIAIGTARLFGVSLSQNFANPYFARTIPDFWRRWHISLSTWFRDYVYIPLGGSRRGRRRTLINIAIVFVVSGLWHGAAWTFVAWGALHALYMVLWIRLVPEGFASRGLTFLLVMLAWVLFRSPDIATAGQYVSHLVNPGAWSARYQFGLSVTAIVMASTTIVGVAEFVLRNKRHGLAIAGLAWSRPQRWLSYALIIAFTLILGRISDQPFIYFQF